VNAHDIKLPFLILLTLQTSVYATFALFVLILARYYDVHYKPDPGLSVYENCLLESYRKAPVSYYHFDIEAPESFVLSRSKVLLG